MQMHKRNYLGRLTSLILQAVSISLAAGAHCGAAGATSLYEVAAPVLPSRPTHQEIARLAEFDVVLLIDKSRSMRYDLSRRSDKKGKNEGALEQFVLQFPSAKMSRWEWCREQAADLAEIGKLPDLRVTLFANKFTDFNGVEARQIASIFSGTKPKGGTYIAKAMKSQFAEYFARRKADPDRTKPLLIAVVTDGCPYDKAALAKSIAEATQRMNNREEISVAFLQVGNDPRAPQLLKDLDDNLVNSEAKFDIVSVKPFDELKIKGLARALVEVVGGKRLATPEAQYNL